MKTKSGKKQLKRFGRIVVMEGMLSRVLEEAVKLKKLLEYKQDTCDLIMKQNKQQLEVIKDLTDKLNHARITKEQGEFSASNA